MARGYKSYKGGKHGGRGVSIAVICAVLVALVSVFVLFIGDSMTLASLKDRLFGPGAAPTETPSAAPTADIPVLIVETPSPSPTPAETPSPHSGLTLKAVFLPDITDDAAVEAAAALVESGTANAVIINMKADSGHLSFVSQTVLAENAEVNAESDPEDAIARLKGAGAYLVGRMSAFKDDRAPRTNNTFATKISDGVIWLDENYHGWLNPYSDGVKAYLTDLSLELTALGFDEILLDNVCFPTRGRPNLLYFGADATTPRTDAIEGFIEDLKATLEGAGAALSCMPGAACLAEGRHEDAGQDLTALAGLCDRIYMRIPETDPLAAFEAMLVHMEGLTAYGTEAFKRSVVPVITPSRAYTDPSAGENLQSYVGTVATSSGFGFAVFDASGRYPGTF
ncbi:putative glycoside hydrolase [Oscillospiraceae bacterium OttesenSCG-928-F05]|nr:putative glycoside hydrolase [Oscillospiraceae bacterium OttesenSCG-928-F05]